MCEKEWCGKWRQTKTVMEYANEANDDGEEKKADCGDDRTTSDRSGRGVATMIGVAEERPE